MLKDYFKLAIENITQRKLRSWLTVIGIVIGIAAVVALISLGQGVKKVITDEFAKMGTDKIIIQPSTDFYASSGIPTLSEHDIEVIRRVKGVEEVGGVLMKSGRVDFKKNVYFTIVLGIPTDETQKLIEETYTLAYVNGRSLKAGDNYKATIGYDLSKEKTFNKPITVGDRITLEGKEFEIVGQTKQTGDPGMDSAIIIPIETAQELFHANTANTAGTHEENGIIVRTALGEDPVIVADNIKRAMRRDRNQKEGSEDFQVQTTAELVESFNVILNALSAIIIGIAAISLFVGGVGIMNTMYTAVLQRTNEIGVMKAIGARNSHILKLFLIESGMLGLIGGAIGVLIGVLLSKIIEFIGKNFLDTLLLRAYFPWYLILGALAFAFIVGTLSGLLPARQAANMNPVDSLRYE
ncbi:MAG: ABC transporter permease [Candidatus Woesearchaeota archaeon]